jgi:hypothetical protein
MVASLDRKHLESLFSVNTNCRLEAFPIQASDDTYSISKTEISRLLIGGSGKQQQILIRIFDDERFGSPRLSSQFLAKCNTSGLKLKKQ